MLPFLGQIPPIAFAVDWNVVRSIAESLTAGIAFAFALQRIPYFWSKAKLSAAYASMRGERDYLRNALEAATAASEGWQAAVEAVGRDIESVRKEMRRLNHKFVVAVRYIADLVTHIRSGFAADEMPPIPHELDDAVKRELDDNGEESDT